MKIINEQQRMISSYTFCGIWGAEVRLKADGRVSSLSRPRNGRIAVAFNSYTTAGGGGRFPQLRRILRRPEAQLRDSGINSRDAVRAFLQQQSPLRLQARHWITRASE
jgi:hypothetical protein